MSGGISAFISYLLCVIVACLWLAPRHFLEVWHYQLRRDDSNTPPLSWLVIKTLFTGFVLWSVLLVVWIAVAELV